MAVRTVQSLSACTVELYLYSPYGPYGLYRPSVPVHYSYICTPLWAIRPVQSISDFTEPQYLYSIPIPLLPLWAVRPVQSLSACTVELYLYSPCGPYRLYRASVPVQYIYTSTPLSACTTVHFTFTFTLLSKQSLKTICKNCIAFQFRYFIRMLMKLLNFISDDNDVVSNYFSRRGKKYGLLSLFNYAKDSVFPQRSKKSF